MNRENILFHLKEAIEAIEGIINEITNNPEYDESEYYIAMQHVYNHVNTAWNTRNLSQNRIDKMNEKDFYLWRKMPKDFDM